MIIINNHIQLIYFTSFKLPFGWIWNGKFWCIRSDLFVASLYHSFLCQILPHIFCGNSQFPLQLVAFDRRLQLLCAKSQNIIVPVTILLYTHWGLCVIHIERYTEKFASEWSLCNENTEVCCPLMEHRKQSTKRSFTQQRINMHH